MAPDEREAIAKSIARFHGVKPNDRAIEIGSANVNGIVADLFAAGTSYTGVDHRSPPCNRPEGNNVHVQANGNDLRAHFDDDAFDWALCNSMLEHDLYFWKTVSELRRVLRPGGILIIGTPTLGFGHHGVSEDLAENPGLPTHPEGTGIFDYYRFTRSTYYRLFFAGCEDVEVLDVDRDGSPRLCGSGRLT